MNIIYPRIASTTGSVLLDSFDTGAAGGALDVVTLRSANKIRQFQTDYSNYLWGIGEKDTWDFKQELDLTSSSALEQITKFVKPKILKEHNQSGVTLILTGKLTAQQVKTLDTLMNTYSASSSQTSLFIYQHTEINKEKVNGNLLVNGEVDSGGDIMAALAKSGAVSQTYTSGIKILKNRTNGTGRYSSPNSTDADKKKSERKDSSRIYIKLYPRDIVFTPPVRKASVGQLSHSRLMQINRGVSNPQLSINSILAFNTYDAQWLDLYTSFFALWYEFGNPTIDVVIGDYVFKDMLFISPPIILNTQKVVSTFNAVMTSETTDLDQLVR